MSKHEKKIETAETEQTFRILQYPEQIAVVRLGSGAMVPEWAESSSVFSITATATHTTLVCAARSVPKKARHVRSFTAFVAHGTPDLEQPGTLVSLIAPLAEIGVSVVTVATFDEPWLLVPQNHASAAADEWRRRGFTVAPATPA